MKICVKDCRVCSTSLYEEKAWLKLFLKKLYKKSNIGNLFFMACTVCGATNIVSIATIKTLLGGDEKINFLPSNLKRKKR